MKSLSLVALLVSSLAFAGDAPLRVVLQPGEPAPELGLFTNEPATIEDSKTLATLKAENKTFKEQADRLEAGSPSPVVFVVVGVVLLLAGGAGGYGLAKAVK